MIEILIVISIISLLASISLGGIVIARDRARKAEATTFIAGLNGAVERYFMDTGRYPGTEWKDGENAFPALYEAIFDEKPPAGRGGPGAPYMDLKRDQVLVADGDGAYRRARSDEINDPAVHKFIQDPWGNPYIYRENRSRLPRRFTIRRAKADLYSTGPDGIDQTILGEQGDDLGNW